MVGSRPRDGTSSSQGVSDGSRFGRPSRSDSSQHRHGRLNGDDSSSDRSRYTAATFLSALLPTSIGRRAISVSVETDRTVYDRDEPVEITVEFENRLPVPVEVPTPEQRRWGWSVDGELEASDERRYTRANPSSFSFRGGETKRASFTWNGRFERVRNGDRHESVVPDPGEYEIRAFVATHEDAFSPSDVTTIRIS
ncbi:hypothetical protein CHINAEXTREME_04090 [Halobiforma lacisalsi AJ5]|uniref:DUF7974 domain-containing protein n=1 Tax=Natronobacterium lacisalsi AJ5 TaxID=358396 RepID=M0LQJ0_NATLA|nr:hypothetical protein [Halobiforma lacisalsi]APW96999.1 hypothetical protein CHINAEXTREME_04090 [Halobiforma lacisalsi AJ5]EMA34714.1 hypothetical protein C445_07330 [Halobiforma lacisalsi AJ5]